MARDPKPIVSFEDSFGKLDIRVSYGRFTMHSPEEVKDRLVLGVLNLGPRQMGPETSEVLVLGVQYPKAASGEATFVSPAVNAKIGSKQFKAVMALRSAGCR